MNETETGLSALLSATARELRVEPPDLGSPFLDHLVSLSLEDLVQQPVDIANELSAVQSELVNLCFREYSTFISVHKCAAAVQTAFDDFDTSLSKLIDCSPDLETASRSFSSETSSIQETRSRINLVRDHQDKLMDLLGIPQLMDACVRNGFYQEAIELAAQMDVLRGHYSTIPIIKAVVKESEQVLQAMLAQLLQLLKEPVKLPSLMKAIGFLRRLGYLEESDLALVFLASRSLFLQAQFQQLERDKLEPVRYLRRYIDVFREHVFDIISQYSTIFDEPHLIISFASRCVDALVSLVRSTVAIIGNDSASLSSILVQLAYCGTSFARVGFDFSSLVVQPFLLVVSSSFAQSLESATADLFAFLKNASRNATFPNALLSPGVISPSKISDFPPMALFANAHYSALNSLRLLAPTELWQRLVHLQNTCLAEATSALFHYIQEVERSWQDADPVSTPSPRAHLLRRSTETQWTPAMRASRRKDSVKVLAALADIWRTELLPSLLGGLSAVYEGAPRPPAPRLDEQIWLLQEWSNKNCERPARNGVDHHDASSLDQDSASSETHASPSIALKTSVTLPNENLETSHPADPSSESALALASSPPLLESSNAESSTTLTLHHESSAPEEHPDAAAEPLDGVPPTEPNVAGDDSGEAQLSGPSPGAADPAITDPLAIETPGSSAASDNSPVGTIHLPESQQNVSTGALEHEGSAQPKKKKKRKGGRNQ